MTTAEAKAIHEAMILAYEEAKELAVISALKYQRRIEECKRARETARKAVLEAQRSEKPAKARLVKRPTNPYEVVSTFEVQSPRQDWDTLKPYEKEAEDPARFWAECEAEHAT